MSGEGVHSPSVIHKHVLQKGKRQWLAKVSNLTHSVLVMVVCPSERSARDEDYQNWMEEILDDLAELKFPALQVVTFLGPGKIDHHTYKLSDSSDSED